jgi:hypothetical protein
VELAALQLMWKHAGRVSNERLMKWLRPAERATQEAGLKNVDILGFDATPDAVDPGAARPRYSMRAPDIASRCSHEW